MRTFKKLLALLIVFSAVQAMAQTDKETTSKLVAAKHLIFNATAAIPMPNPDLNRVLSILPNGKSSLIQLNGSQYQLIINKDSVEAFLPYYGKAYTTMGNDDGIKFKSKNFDYNASPNKKGRWVIDIKPKDAKDVRSMTLRISPDGYATLHVNNTNRQSISYNGVISEPVVIAENKKKH
ncbi:DUF4251 domain-containing protein [Pedobacter gandavensis]|uniref:DUF4251 domain-containing protein n=1 Tax=Pedobacter gandavensis TaxID=2679963 RepID=A0ABR6F1K4_9SPHI|nr:DUF4251 domain-containing protein [Pedobacter gandavensis]MBB2151107.1 DUF4251 domain-containing protein [Pedobacter gandavensis]